MRLIGLILLVLAFVCMPTMSKEVKFSNADYQISFNVGDVNEKTIAFPDGSATANGLFFNDSARGQVMLYNYPFGDPQVNLTQDCVEEIEKEYPNITVLMNNSDAVIYGKPIIVRTYKDPFKGLERTSFFQVPLDAHNVLCAVITEKDLQQLEKTLQIKSLRS